MDGPKGFTPFQVGIVAVFAVGAVIGLFVFANFSGGGSRTEEIGEVTIWGTLPSAIMKDALSELAGADDRFAKVTYVEKSAATYSTELADALASGAGPDLVIITQEMLASERNKLHVIPFTSIPQRTYVDSYVPLFELFLTSTGTYGVPVALDPLVLYYNRAILSSSGLVAPPSTWEAVAGFATAVTQRTPNGVIARSAIALGEYQNVRNARAILSLMLLQAGTPITSVTESGTRAVFADDDSSSYGASPAESAVNYYAQFADPAKTVYSWNRSLPESRQMFVAGDVALYVGFASERPYLSAANPNLDFDMAPIPVPGTLRNRVGYANGYAFAIPKAADNSVGGLSAALALAAPARGAAIASGLSIAPAFRGSLVASADDRYRSIYYAEALTAKGWISPAPARTDQVFSAMITDITAGRSSVSQALKDAAQTIDASFR